MKEIKDLYIESYSTQKMEIEESIRKWKDTPSLSHSLDLCLSLHEHIACMCA